MQKPDAEGYRKHCQNGHKTKVLWYKQVGAVINVQMTEINNIQ